MPTYVYRCPKCQAPTEARRAVADRDLPATCPDCGADAARELVVSAGQVMIPRGFGKHIHTTGLKSELGGGPWEGASTRRWYQS